VRAVVQRVTKARVVVDGAVVGEIVRPGLCVLLGVGDGDGDETADAMAKRLWNLRILPDSKGRMNCSCAELDAPILVVSQFTLYGDTSRGRRPSFTGAMPAGEAEPLVERVVAALRRFGATIATGRFGAAMRLELVNDGPVTLIVET
jgi:D-tyrosyl-tRNA(Tyr) deacylase